MLKVWWVLPLPAAEPGVPAYYLRSVQCILVFFLLSMTSSEAFIYFKGNGRALYSTCSIHQGYESPFLDSNAQLLAFTYGIKNESSASGEIQILHFCSVSSVTRQQLRVLLQTFLIGMQPLDYPCSLWMIYCHPLRQCYLLFCPSEVQTLCSLLCCAI